MNGKARAVRRASVIALAGNCALAALKIGAGFLSKSGALLGDGVDSSMDVALCAMALVAVRAAASPADTKHPWGHGRAETVATAFLSFAMFFMGAQLAFSSGSKLLAGRLPAAPSMAGAAAALVSVAGKALLAWSQHALGRRAGSALLRANAKNMAGDVLISLGVLAGLAISAATGSGAADAVFAILIGLWIVKTAVGIFLEVNLELLDGSGDMAPYRTIFDAVNSVEGADHPHRARMRRIAGFWDIDLDIEVDPRLTVSQAHGIALRVEEEIKLRLENVYDIMVHVEPRGEGTQEGYGISEEEVGG
ncbi:MAG: cation diffusion facilitator family transporter [Oscillospiraceae bacterium]|jgi:cation diffusion facilitator family transporter|nr:cation diffusion facilitator family transporter [Oscillospiraceae bacterium]